ncbi:MAG TPA: CCA tRNA nucleotidyltransferase, partial [Candidatus Defluviicoccus seviourii]|nr:CCA tRNA nucleotidyltransferase [Candidatus Defluviicoccus seviourii]
RRDFTINAMSCTPDGTIYDYFGGLDDLAVGRVRFVGDATQRIEEDALRLLRFFRFYAVYGEPPADEHALAACRARAADVARLSVERVRGELLRLLMAPEPADVLQLMRDNGVLAHVLPEAGRLERLKRLCWLESHALVRPSVKPDPTRRLAALFDADGGIALRLANRLKFSLRERKRLVTAAARPWPGALADDPIAVAKALYHEGVHAVRDVALIEWADELIGQAKLPRARTEAWCRVLDTIDNWREVTFPLKGRDAIALGVPHGRSIGRLLRGVEDWWEEGGYVASRADCLEKLKAVLEEESR